MIESLPCLTLVFYAVGMVWLMHHVKFWAPLPIFKIKEVDPIGRKGLCCVGGAPFCNTMLNDGVRETASALSPNKIIYFRDRTRTTALPQH